MNKYAYVEWLSFATKSPEDTSVEEARAKNDQFETANYRWSLVGDYYDLSRASYGSGEVLMEWLLAIEYPIIFVIPGEKTVVRQVAYREKEKRHFGKMLPYALEDSIVNDVDTLHFVIGQQTEPQATIAYVDSQWFAGALNFIKQQHNSVNRCMVDFQCLQRIAGDIVCWFHNGRWLLHSDEGLGFTTTDVFAADFLREWLSLANKESGETLPRRYQVYLSHTINEKDHISLETVTQLFHTLQPEANIQFHSAAPPLTVDNVTAINFCAGEYATSKKNAGQATQLTIVVIIALLSVCLFLTVNFLSIYQSTQKINIFQQNIETATRQVVTEGNMTNPVRLLTNRLEALSVGSSEPSQVVSLLRLVAPVIQTLDVELLTINYSGKERMLRLSVQAASFNIVEKLRADMEAKGLIAELLSSNAIDNKFQARLRIRLEKQ